MPDLIALLGGSVMTLALCLGLTGRWSEHRACLVGAAGVLITLAASVGPLLVGHRSPCRVEHFLPDGTSGGVMFHPPPC